MFQEMEIDKFFCFEILKLNDQKWDTFIMWKKRYREKNAEIYTVILELIKLVESSKNKQA